MTTCTICAREVEKTFRVSINAERHHACQTCVSKLRAAVAALSRGAPRRQAIRAATDDAKLFHEFGASMRRAAQLASYYHRTDCKPVLQALRSYFTRQQGGGRGNRKIAA